MKKLLNLCIFICILLLLMIYGVNTTVAETNDNDEEMILSLINEKLNCDYVDYEYLYDFSLNNRYVLITGDNCYLIYDYFLHDYVEFSCSGVSIYNDINGEYIKIYFLPTYYFYYYNSKFYEIRGNRQLTENEVLSFKDNEEEIINRYMNCKSNMNNTRTGSTYISNSYYFENLIDNMGTNDDGSCSFVAMEMVLSYYDSIENDNVIDEQYDVNESKYFSSYSNLDVSTYNNSPGVDDNFHDDLVDYAIVNNYIGGLFPYVSLTNMPVLLNYYFSERNLSKTDYVAGLAENKYNFCKGAIDYDVPVIIGFLDGINIQDAHNVVGYGYDSTGIYANFGWQDADWTNVNINNYTMYGAYYFTFDSSHYCSNNYLWTSANCHGTMCPCGTIQCSHNYYYNNHYEVGGHTMVCSFCGNTKLEAHDFVPSGLGYICTVCSYFTRHPIYPNGTGGENE